MNTTPLAWCLLLAVAGASRTCAEPGPPSEPFIPPAHRDTTVRFLWCAKNGDTWRAVMDGQPGIGFAAALTHAGAEANGPSDPVFHFAVPGRVNFLAALTPPDEADGGNSSVYLVTERLGE